jgi:hypothetical protein
MPRIVAACVCLLLLSWPSTPRAQRARRGRVYIDRGACQGEACGFGPWKPTATTVLRARPDARSRKVGEVRPGPCVLALTGEVHVLTPGRFVVRRPRGRYRPGDVLFVYTYVGEEVYKVRHRGRWIAEQQLAYVPEPGPAARSECEANPHCWGVFERRPDSESWAKVRTAAGIVGWTNQPANFIDPYWQTEEDCRELKGAIRRR